MIFPADDIFIEAPEATPLYAAAAAASEANIWTSINNWSVPRVISSVEQEYLAAKKDAVIADLGAVMRYAIRGEDAAAFLARITTAPATALDVGEGARGLILRDDGDVIDYADVSRLSDDLFLLTTPSAHARWLQLGARGLQVALDDISNAVAALGVFGPGAHDALARAGLKLPGDGVAASAMLRGVETAARPIRFGAAPGIELIFPSDEALTIWERLSRRTGLPAIGLDAMEVLRIESGAPRPGVDFTPATPGANAGWRPADIGLAHLAPLDQGWFSGRRGLRDRPENGERRLVVLAIDADEIVSGAAVFSAGKNIGRITSRAWSPDHRRVVAFADVLRVSPGDTYEISGGPDADTRVTARPLMTPEASLARAFENVSRAATESRR